MIKQINFNPIKIAFLVLSIWLFIGSSARADIEVELGPAPGYGYLIAKGTVQNSFFSLTKAEPGFDGGSPWGQAFNVEIESGSDRRTYSASIPMCNNRLPNLSAAISFVNGMLASGVTFSYTSGPMPTGQLSARLRFDCWDGINKNYLAVAISGTGQGITIVNPPNSKSVCSLNGQNLNLNYSSTSLNVNGLTQSTSLYISCGSGDAQDYQLRLTGSNVTSGRLNFGNGVSAQVSLNGLPVSANGSGISLNGLTSRNLSISATLVGSASTSGISNSNGVLVLDAL